MTMQLRQSVFVCTDGSEQVQRGWLTHESLVQLKFFDNPVSIWKKKFRSARISYRVSPIDLARKMSALREPNSSVTSLGEDSEQQSNFSDSGDARFPFVEVAVMIDGQDDFQPQGQFGTIHRPENFVVAQALTLNPHTLAFMIDFYVWPAEQDAFDDLSSGTPELPEHIGFAYLIPSNLQGSNGNVTIPITGTRHHPIGELTLRYLIVKPLKGYRCTAELTFAKFWKRHKRGLDVGHRGAGNARRTDIKKDKLPASAKVENVLENTVASFNYAARHGADMVELDVQLSKDKVPVIYHDFHINIAIKKRRRTANEEEPLTVAVKDLTSQQLHDLKLQPAERHAEARLEFTDEDIDDNQPFPTLKTILTAVDGRVGCNVEIKAPLQYADGSWELDYPFDMNEYLDIILSELLQHSGDRFILLSCFHPDVCTMIRYKQNKYPLLFLTQGVTSKYPAYHDPRTSSTQMAAYFAKTTGILGVNAHTEELLANPDCITLVKNKKLILFCWGEDNNTTEGIEALKRKGVDGVIYDKVDCLIDGDRQEVYLMQPMMASEMLEAAKSCHFQTADDASDSVGPMNSSHVAAVTAVAPLPPVVAPPTAPLVAAGIATPAESPTPFTNFQRPFQAITTGKS
ncbi:glycerophosphocholine phosphodiesterase GPCPD1-like isoform X3 [Varroa destructor]|uniref:GP-PDE domain-containing protein n=1 Tax=Varroa destructor TaxID=109461 RepID=A0A7M7K505_VARDE|nr:glycerophosphocholine phosphodiesterase GPCPD1-like isoform X3 [Varroa destructor]XP_022660550.1 glycerophosphocholine phosphodiesterase GPCPD1-like isoform X3 [Varroa destructor]XP_022660560.1 glycerophosphocholine phosphodiesterase GPCPD1-like isoform X3 [Varroa destructor]